MQSFSDYYKGVCGQFLSHIAMSLSASNKKILERLVFRGKEAKFYMHSYTLLESELKVKPEHYFDKIYELINYELEGTIEQEELNYLNEQAKRYPAIPDLRKAMRQVYQEFSE